MYLNCHSYYSLRYGIISEKEIVEFAQAQKIPKIALTDINNTSGCLNFVRLAQKVGINPVIGVDFRTGAQQNFVALAKNNQGFKEINDFLSFHSHHKIEIPQKAPLFKEVFIIYPFSKIDLTQIDNLQPNEYIGIHHTELNKLTFTDIEKSYAHKLIALNSCTFRNKKDFNTHRLLRAIDNNILLSKLTAEQQAFESDIYYTREEFQKLYSTKTYLIGQAENLLSQCQIDFDFSANRPHQNKLNYAENKEEDNKLLKELCRKGLKYRYEQESKTIIDRMNMEIEMIEKMDFVPFFLINWDIINYAKSQSYFHVGRGSGANSLVAYLLGITDVDPIELDLYFERFMNLYRTSPPDFDIDFSWKDREDVTRYIFERFGSEGQVALLATYNTFKHSAAVRELGKVFGLPKHEIDILSDGKFEYEKLDKLSKLVIIYSKELDGKPNYLSIHAGGIIISEKPIHWFTATDLPPKGFPTTQFDMIISEDVGLYKYDILAQRGLGKIKDAISLISINQPDKKIADIHHVKPLFEDIHINTLVSRAECIGCFYVESPAMRMLLRKLEVDNYLGLVAASSIIRPGVAKSGMMREYIMRHKNPQRRKQAHPILYQIMPETYGVMVYQEDVIKVAHFFAGLDLGEADVLRRGMSGKYRSREEFDKVQEKFMKNCRDKGYPEATSKEIWRQIESFAGYAFAKGHSASYAVESYQSLYLKCYFPVEYMVAVINNGGGFYSTELYVHEAKRCGAEIEAPCINHSHYPTWVYGRKIFLGFHILHSMESQLAIQIVQERNKNGSFESLEDFIERVEIGIEQLDILIRINAFRGFGIDKRTLLWRGRYLLSGVAKPSPQLTLFKSKPKTFELPQFDQNSLENAFDEIELLGFPLCSPFLLLEKPITESHILSRDIPEYKNKMVTLFGYLITVKYTSTNKGERMHFGTFIDENGDWIDTVHFPPVAKKYPFRGKAIYKIEGLVTEEFGFHTLEVVSMHRLNNMPDQRFVG
ncbi:MAG TPA: DNA polymerase III subunit alpha [Saprospiraceae bacterium]|nr:DNA polymerase III subunit alpha [Saprospiraceae bacterium]